MQPLQTMQTDVICSVQVFCSWMPMHACWCSDVVEDAGNQLLECLGWWLKCEGVDNEQQFGIDYGTYGQLDWWKVVLYFNVLRLIKVYLSIINHVVCRSDMVWKDLEVNTFGIGHPQSTGCLLISPVICGYPPLGIVWTWWESTKVLWWLSIFCDWPSVAQFLHEHGPKRCIPKLLIRSHYNNHCVWFNPPLEVANGTTNNSPKES